MTQKRKAELQRKLSVAPLPKPPDGLADRIKADIPKYLLDADRERSRLRRSVAFNLRVAASILLLVGGAYFMIAVLSKTGAGPGTSAFKVAATPPPATATVAQVMEQKKEVDQFAAKVVAPREQARSYGDEEKESRRNEIGLLDKAANGKRADVPVTADSRDRDRALAIEDAVQEITVSASAPAVPPPVAAAAAAPAPPPEPVAAPTEFVMPEPQKSAKADAGPKLSRAPASLMSEANAAVIPVADQSKVFGVSVDREAFDRLKVSIERGERPEAGSVDVEALVNYFAGPPVGKVKGGVRMEVEVSSAPTTTGMCCVLRVTIDTAENNSPLPVAKAARLEVAFDSKAVRMFERVGGNESTKLIQPILLPKTSVTLLYNFQLQPKLKGRRRLATVTLRYESLPQGKVRTITDSVNLDDISESWVNGSRRHKLASLGALWGESLKDEAPAKDVAVKAEELAKQKPDDERARELATASQLTEKSKEQK